MPQRTINISPNITHLTPKSYRLPIIIGITIVVLEKRSEKIGEDVRVEIAEPKEGFFERVSPVGEEKVGGFVVGCPVEGGEVRVEVGVEEVDVGGEDEEVRRGGGQRTAEER